MTVASSEANVPVRDEFVLEKALPLLWSEAILHFFGGPGSEKISIRHPDVSDLFKAVLYLTSDGFTTMLVVDPGLTSSSWRAMMGMSRWGMIPI